MLSPLLVALQVAAVQSLSSAPRSSPAVFNGRAGELTVRASASTASPAVDGQLDEPVWREAALLTGFSLYQPIDQRPRTRFHRSTRLVFADGYLLWHSRLRAARCGSSHARRPRPNLH
jgi:hypothetical protein